MPKQLQAVVVEPGKLPETKTIKHALESFQEVVGGYIANVHFTYDDKSYVMVVDEERGLKDNEPCRLVNGIMFVGTFMVLGYKGGRYVSLTDFEASQMNIIFLAPHVMI
jgi:hypothetical protein